MGQTTIGHRITSQIKDINFSKEKTILMLRMLAVSAVIIFLVETLLMLSLEYIFALPKTVVFLLDGFLLFAILFPLNYFFTVRPMLKQIEERSRANLELAKSHEILEGFFAVNDVLIAYLDTNFNFIRVNDSYASADGHVPDYYVGKNHFDLFPNTENFEIFTSVAKAGQAYRVVEKPFEYSDNPERGISYWDWSLLPIKNPDGQVFSLLLVLNDATDRKLTQMALEKSERRFRGVFNQTFQHICLLDCTGNILLANQTAVDFTGVSEENLVGKTLWDAPWWASFPDSTCQIITAVDHASLLGETARCEQQVRSISGRLATMDISIKPMLDERGRATMLVYEARDITDRIEAEQALKRSDEEIKRLYDMEKRAHNLAETLRSAGLALSGSLDINTVIETLLDHFYQVLPYQSAHTYMLDDEDHLSVRQVRGEEAWAESERLLGERFNLRDFWFLESLFTNREIISIADIKTYSGVEVFPCPPSVRSWIGIPLLAGEHVIGMCALEHPQPGFFTEDFLDWVKTLTNQAAVAIQNAWLFEQVADSRERLQALSHRLVEVQENERHYIARELHDEAGQALASLMVGLRLMERDSANPNAVIARCAELRQTADSVLENLHRLAIDLRPTALDHLGLAAALQQHAQKISTEHHMALQFEAVGTISRFPVDIETAIYRIVQEALTNIVRHAKATRIGLVLDQRSDKLRVMIEDNGVGFDLQSPKVGHLGLVGMRERADMLGGTLSVESSPETGTTIILEIPCPSES